MNPSKKQESLLMANDAFVTRSSKTQLLFFLFLLVLLSMVFAAGALFHSVLFASRCEASCNEANSPPPPLACMTSDDFTKLVENSTASLKSSLHKAPRKMDPERNLLRRDPTTSNADGRGVETANAGDLKAIIIANLTAQLDRSLTEILSSKLLECGGGESTTTRPAASAAAEQSTSQTTPAGVNTKPVTEGDVEHGSGSGTFISEEKICPEGWSLEQDSCYMIDNSAPSQDWKRAELACREFNSSLVAINSARENEFVNRLAQRKAPSYEYMWIGLRRRSPRYPFRWAEGGPPFDYYNWATGEPNNDQGLGEDCVHMYLTNWDYRAGKWNDEKCLNPSNGGPMVYMCERPALPVHEGTSGQREPEHSASGDSSENMVSSGEDDIYIWYGH